ncbi:MAG: xylulokinase [Tissierellaceae bacterium]|nr:xylulokinase [Tissierellaceae bacterium]
MRYLLGIDLGTSATKTILFEETGRIIASHSVEYPLYQPVNGWAEQEPDDWWNAVIASIKTVLLDSRIDSSNIVGLGISGQMHGLVMLDENNDVIRPSIIWCDQRTAKECEEITNKVGAKRLIEITANPALTGFTASKIMWVKNNEPENYAMCKRILLPKDYIRFKLTGVYATDVSDASGMQLLDVKNRCWSEEVLEKLEIDKTFLAEVFESPEVTGKITDSAAKLTGLSTSTIVVAGAGDNAAAAVGTGVVHDGIAFTTIGTSGVVFAHTSDLKIDHKGRIHTFCSAVPGAWHVMGVTQGAGLSLKWFRDNLCSDIIVQAENERKSPYYLMDNMAKDIPIGAGNLIYLPYLMGERTPHLDPNCRGVFFGLSAMHTRAHMIRAVLEGVTYSLKDCYEILKMMDIDIDKMIACGGGGTSNLWKQMMADIYGCSVNSVNSDQGAALGAAILAGVGAGVFSSVEEGCAKLVTIKDKCNPVEKQTNCYTNYYNIYKDLYPKLKSSFDKLASLS